METVTVGCRLPNGLKLEVGYRVTGKVGDKITTQVSKDKDYASVTLKGTHSHTEGVRRLGVQVPAVRNPEPAFTAVPKALWERWCREHASSPMLTGGQIFVVPSTAGPEVKAASLDASSKSPNILQPLDRGQALVLGDSRVEPAKFDE